MRMRKKKNGDARLKACDHLIFRAPKAPMDEPSSAIGDFERTLLEIGAGKGGFACEMSSRNSDAAYYAMERVSDCVVLAAELAESTAEHRSGNLRFIIDTADNLCSYFAPETVDGIFLNFSDPWSKKGYAKRRLTHRRYLSLYFSLLKEGGRLTFKTDNVSLFDFSLEEISSIGLSPDRITRDLHSSEWNPDNVMTEYETAFSSQGIKINMLSVVKPAGFVSEVPEELKCGGRKFFKKSGEVND